MCLYLPPTPKRRSLPRKPPSPSSSRPPRTRLVVHPSSPPGPPVIAPFTTTTTTSTTQPAWPPVAVGPGMGRNLGVGMDLDIDGTANIFLPPISLQSQEGKKEEKGNKQPERRRSSVLLSEVERAMLIAKRLRDAVRRGSVASYNAVRRGDRERERDRERDREDNRTRRRHRERHHRSRSISVSSSDSSRARSRSRSRERRREKVVKVMKVPGQTVDPVAREIGFHADELARRLARDKEVEAEHRRRVEEEREKQEREEEREAKREEREAKREDREAKKEQREREQEAERIERVVRKVIPSTQTDTGGGRGPIHPLPPVQGADWRDGISWAWPPDVVVAGGGGILAGGGGGGRGGGRNFRLATASPDGDRRGGNHIHVHTAPLVQGPQIHSHTSPPINVSNSGEGRRNSLQRLAQLLTRGQGSQQQEPQHPQTAPNAYNNAAYISNGGLADGINMSGAAGGTAADMRVPLNLNGNNAAGSLREGTWYQVGSHMGNAGGGAFERGYGPVPGSRVGEREYQRARVYTIPGQNNSGLDGILY